MATGDPKIFEEIETSADYYGPQVYAGGWGGYQALLSFYHDLETYPDSLGWEFIPLTTTRSRSRDEAKIFAVGVLPPAANVTGRILDRSATYRSGETPPVNLNDDDVAAIEHQQSIIGQGGFDCPAAIAERYVGQAQSNSDMLALWAGPNDYQADGSIKPGIEAWYNINTHCEETIKAFWRLCGISDPRFQFTGEVWESGPAKGQIKPPGVDTVPWKRLAVENDAWIPGNSSEMPKRGDAVYAWTGTWVGNAFLKYGTKHSHMVLSVTGTTVQSANGGAIGQGITPGTETWKKGEDGYWYTYGAKVRQVEGWVSYEKIPKDGTPVTGDAGQGDWKDNGSDEAQQAQKEKDKTDGSDIESDSLGAKLTAAQRVQIAEAQAAIDAMKNTPPLRLLVNPQQFAVKGSKIVQDGNWGRNGPIIEHWGNDQDKISASGKIAGFYALDMNNAVGPGLTRGARHFSKSWANLMSLHLFYKNNGGLYLRDHLSSEGKQNLSMLGSVYIYYDNILYIGSFDSFNITESEDAPFSAEYNFEFTVRAAFLLDRPDSAYDIQYSSEMQTVATKDMVPATSEPEAPVTRAEEVRRQSIEGFGGTTEGGRG